MSENLDAYNQVVQAKMLARAERHVRERQADVEALGHEAAQTEAAQAQADQAQQVLVAARLRRETATQARRNRPNLVVQYKANPNGVRHVSTLRDVCLRCGSENVRTRSDHTPHVLVCRQCNAEWFVSRCWSCPTGMLDSRDPETPPCPQCGRTKCAVCGACNPQGCSTNPYSAGFRQQDEALAPTP